MFSPLLLTVLPLFPAFIPQGTPAAPPTGVRSPAVVTIDGSWEGSGGLIVLRERAGGQVQGYSAGTPATQITSGMIVGSTLTLILAGEDGDGPLPPLTFTGTLSGSTIVGSFDKGSGPVPLTLTRSTSSLVEEHWLLINPSTSDQVEARRMSEAGVFYGAEFSGVNQCDFLACGGQIDSWTVTGSSHLIETSSSGPCTTASTLTGTLDPTTKILGGSFSTTDCGGTTVGDFLGGKRGLTNRAHMEGLVEMIADLCDALEAESATVIDAFDTGYLHNGRTRADLAAEFAAWYADYDSIEATAILSRIITVDDGEIVPFLSGPYRLDWHLTITGIPASGGLRETILDYTPEPFDDSVYYLGIEGGRRVFVGNNESAPFTMNMPIALGEGDLMTFGIWPYGVHEGGHPEGHPGMDIEYAPGASVLAAAAGTVIYIEHNINWPTQWDLLLEVRPGIVVQYDHMGSIDAAIAVGTSVIRGQVLGGPSAPYPHTVVHLGLRANGQAVCPNDHFSPSGHTVFQSLWSTARYWGELVEPLACNPIDVSFPLTASRTRISGSLSPARMEFTRLDALTSDITYTLFDAANNVTEYGTVHFAPFKRIGEVNLTPTSPTGPTRLGVLNIEGQDMMIDWDTSVRPTSLAGASHYVLD